MTTSKKVNSSWKPWSRRKRTITPESREPSSIARTSTTSSVSSESHVTMRTSRPKTRNWANSRKQKESNLSRRRPPWLRAQPIRLMIQVLRSPPGLTSLNQVKKRKTTASAITTMTSLKVFQGISSRTSYLWPRMNLSYRINWRGRTPAQTMKLKKIQMLHPLKWKRKRMMEKRMRSTTRRSSKSMKKISEMATSQSSSPSLRLLERKRAFIFTRKWWSWETRGTRRCTSTSECGIMDSLIRTVSPTVL